MARIVGYIGTSLDGFIAGPNGELDWLEEEGDIDYGEFAYDRFYATIETLVMGRATYDWVRENAGDWPYPGKQTIVVTSRPLDDAPEGVTAHSGPLENLVADLASRQGGDIWCVGGGRLQSALVQMGAIGRIEIYVTPILLGDGIPLWAGLDRRIHLTLEDARALEGGVVRLLYRR